MCEPIMNPGMGWLPDYPDFRDFTMEHDEVPLKLRTLGQRDSIKTMLKKAGITQKPTAEPPTSIDLRQWSSPIEDQGNLGSCTANAGVAIIEYFEKRAFGKFINASRLFLYKTTRNLMRTKGDTGAYIRTTMGALALFGVPPEEYWPYRIANFDKEPEAFQYSFAQNYQTICYYRLDPPGIMKDVLLKRIRTYLAAGLPTMFGFTVYSSISQADKTGKIPFPTNGERVLWRTRDSRHGIRRQDDDQQ